jgi:hypothetical protein
MHHCAVQVLNEVNHSDRVHYPIMGPGKPGKPGKVLERISTAAHKIHILVSLL